MSPLHVDAVELRRVRIPLLAPFRTSYGVDHYRDAIILRVCTREGVEGWGECVADVEPLYSPEYAEGAQHLLRHHLIPRVLAAGPVTGADIAGLLRPVQGHPMAKASLEMAVLDAELRASGVSFGERLGAVRTHVDAGVSIGIQDSIDRLLDVVADFLAQGYQRIKLKIEPGHDIEPVQAVRERFGDELMLQVDANAAYTLHDDHVAALRALDPFGLTLLEQPLAPDDIPGHAELATRIATPICLDESVVSERSARFAISIGACAIVNIKAGRVGGYLEGVAVHDTCRAHGIPVWCGGMLEMGLGRAANVALAALPGFTLPGDTSASSRYFAEDLTEPFVLDAGRLAVPTGPGLGVLPRPEALAKFTTSVELVTR